VLNSDCPTRYRCPQSKSTRELRSKKMTVLVRAHPDVLFGETGTCLRVGSRTWPLFARYLSQLDTAAREEPTEARVAKVTRLTEKPTKL
jgi:hypothetical protein